MNKDNVINYRTRNSTTDATDSNSYMQPVFDHIKASRLDDALACLEQFLTDGTGVKSDVLCQMGVVLIMKNDDLKAEDMLLQAVKSDPTPAEGFFNLGLLYKKQGFFNKALPFFKEFILLNGHDAETFELMGDCCMSLNNFDDAIIFYDSCLKINPKSLSAAINLAELYLKAGKNQQAIQALKIALVSHRDQKQLYFALGEIHKLQNEWENAIGNFRKVVSLDDSNARAFFELGYCCYQLNLTNQAIPLLSKAYKLDPLLTDTLLYLGKAYEIKKNRDSAVSAYREWVEMVRPTQFEKNDPMYKEFQRVCQYLVGYFTEKGNADLVQNLQGILASMHQPEQNTNQMSISSGNQPLSLQIND